MPNIKISFKSHKLLALSFVAVLVVQALPALVPKVHAGTLTYGMVRTDRMNASQATKGTVCAKTTSASQTEAAVVVQFPTGFTVSSTTSNWSVSTATTTSWPKDPADGTTSATAWPGITAPSAGNQISGQKVQFTSTDLTASTWYCFNWTNASALTNPSSTGTDEKGMIITCSNSTDCAGTGSGGGTTGNLDTSTWATATVGASCSGVGCDQIAVTATVDPSFSFSLSGNSAALGTLSTSSPSAASAINATVSTNAFRGWNLWAADYAGTPGLTSTSASKTIAYSPSAGSSAATLGNGSEGFNVGAAAASGTTCNSVTIDGNFASGGTSYRGGGLDNIPRIVAVSTGVADTCSVPLTVNASRSATTPAATDYAATVTVIAAGRF